MYDVHMMNEEDRNRARAKLISDISIDQLIVDLKGKQFRHLVEAHMRRFRSSLPAVITASMEFLTPEEKTIGEAIIDEFNHRGYDQAFWRSDASEILSSVSCDLNDAFFPAAADPAAIFSIFQIVTGNFAWMAYEQKKLRKFAGIRLGWFR
jgi:hypothetical protein